MFNSLQLSDFRNKHKGKACYICGLGESLSLLSKKYRNIMTIGMEDIGLLFTPTYLTAIHTLDLIENDFISNRKQIDDILSSKCKFIFATHDLPFKYTNPIEMKRKMLNSQSIDKIFDQGCLCQYRRGFMITISLALFMGFQYIGLIGIDYAGERIVNKQMSKISFLYDKNGFWNDMKKGFKIYLDYATEKGIQIFNLSPISIINDFPKLSLDEFYNRYGHAKEKKS